MKVSANAPCPCGSATKYKKCCGVYHGGRPAPPRRLMRARYCAFATGNVAYLMHTVHPDGPHFRQDRDAWREELVEYCRSAEFGGLTVLEDGDLEDGDAFVTFTVELAFGGEPAGFTERSRFRRDGNRWKYFDAEML